MQAGNITVGLKNDEDKKTSVVTTHPSILEGIGSGRVYYALTQMAIDGAFAGDDQIALEMVQYLLRNEGLFVGFHFTLGKPDIPGGSCGLNVVGALWAAKHLGPGHTIVTILCDSGHNYKSNSIFSESWQKSKNLNLERTTLQEFLDAYDPTTRLIIHK